MKANRKVTDQQHARKIDRTKSLAKDNMTQRKGEGRKEIKISADPYVCIYIYRTHDNECDNCNNKEASTETAKAGKNDITRETTNDTSNDMKNCMSKNGQ